MAYPVIVCLDGGYVEGRWLASWLAWAWRHSRGDDIRDTSGETAKTACCPASPEDDADHDALLAHKLSLFVERYGSSNEAKPSTLTGRDDPLRPNEALPHFALLSIGRPGYLRSTILSSLDTEIEAMSIFLDSLGIRQPVHFVARNLSATVTLAFAARYPDRVHSVTLVSALLGPALNRSLRNFITKFLLLGTNLWSNLQAYQMHRIIAGMTATKDFSKLFLTDPRLRSRLPMPDSALFDELANYPSAIELFKHYETCIAWGGERRAGLLRDYRQLRHINQTRQDALMKSVSVPVLAFHGELDKQAPIALVQRALDIAECNKVGQVLSPSITQRQLISFRGTGQMLPPMDVGWKALNFMQTARTKMNKPTA
jgi:pimeloyl-ACP methyl ester carboxylesterase